MGWLFVGGMFTRQLLWVVVSFEAVQLFGIFADLDADKYLVNKAISYFLGVIVNFDSLVERTRARGWTGMINCAFPYSICHLVDSRRLLFTGFLHFLVIVFHRKQRASTQL